MYLWRHLVRVVLDIVELSLCLLHPAVNVLQGLVKVVQTGDKLLDFLDLRSK